MFKFLKDHCAPGQVNLILAEGIFDFILHINLRKGTYLWKYKSKSLPYSLEKEGKYSDFLQSLQNRLCSDIEEFSENMKLLKVMGMLSIQDLYTVQYQLLIKGHVSRKRILFSQGRREEDIIAFCEDITDVSEKTQEAPHQKDSGAGKQERYIAYLVHEIGTSLNSIYGNLRILQTEKKYQGNKYLENAVLSAEHLLQLVNSVLRISAVRNDRSVMKLEAVTLEDLVEYPGRIFEQEAAKKNIRLRFLVGKPVYQYLYLNKDIIWQIIINLISNAIKYTNDGGKVICHITEAYLEEKRVKLLIEVSDTGIGIDSEFLSAIWEDYTRERRKKEAAGSGLGLALTRHLVELLQGSIHIASRVGHGTEVSVALEADGDDMRYEAFLPSPPHPAKDAPVKRVLVAEDEEGNMELLCRYLHEMGITADKTYDGEEVIEIFGQSEENYYDAILIDIHMPNKSGMEAIRAIRGMDRKDSGMPIIAMTADIDVVDKQKIDALSAEVSAYLRKPYCLEDIRYTLSKYQGQ